MNDDTNNQNNINSNDEQHTKKFEAIITPNPNNKNILRPEKDNVQRSNQGNRQNPYQSGVQGSSSNQGKNILRPNTPMQNSRNLQNPQSSQNLQNPQRTQNPQNYRQGSNTGRQSSMQPNRSQRASIPISKRSNQARTAANTQNKRSAANSGRNAGAYNRQKSKAPAAKTAFKHIEKSTLVFYSVLITIVLLATTIISAFALSAINDVLAISRPSEKITVLIEEDMKTAEVIAKLKDKDLIKNKGFCILFAKLQKYDKVKYQSGIHELRPNMGLEGMLQTIRSARTSNKTVTLVFPEGYTLDQIFEKLEKFDVCSASSLYSTLNEIDFSKDFSFIKQIENKDDRYRYLEGYLYPDTYNFFIGENATSVIRKFLNNFKVRWSSEYADQAKKLNMTVDEIITLASIIEKEGKNSEQMLIISGILHNRLNDKTGSLSRLDCDSTPDYIKNIDKKYITTSEYDKLITLYNTYQVSGLPLGSICNPGDDAIYAALFPDETNYKFFRHDKAGKIYLAYTLAEHNANESKVNAANSALSD